MSATLKAVQVAAETAERGHEADLLTAAELAPILVARAEFDEAQTKLTKVREHLRRAKELGSMNLHAERDVARDAASQLLGEHLSGPLGSPPPKRTVTEEDRLLSVALPDLEKRERELSQLLLMSQGYLRAAVCNALNAALQRRVHSYVAAVNVLSSQLTGLFALDQLLGRFINASAIDPAGMLRHHSKLAAPAVKYLPRGCVQEQFTPVHYLLDGSRLAEGPQYTVLRELTAQLEVHVNLDALARNL